MTLPRKTCPVCRCTFVLLEDCTFPAHDRRPGVDIPCIGSLRTDADAERLSHNHAGLKGVSLGHFCPEWDEMYICDACDEFEACSCYPEDV